MPLSDGWRKYLEAGAVLSHVTRVRAEEIVRELVNAGDLQRGQAEDWIDDLVERSRRRTEDLLALVRHEVDAQLEHLGITTEDLTAQVLEMVRSTRRTPAARGDEADGPADEAASADGRAVPPKKNGTKKAARKARAKAAGTKAAPVKESTPKKAGTEKSASKKSAAKRGAPKKAGSKKAAAKKAAAKKAASGPPPRP